MLDPSNLISVYNVPYKYQISTKKETESYFCENSATPWHVY